MTKPDEPRIPRRKFIVATAGLGVAASACTRTDRSSTSPRQRVEWTEQTDVIIVGGGGAGLVAAISAKEGGSDVLVLEKAASLGGNTKASGAIIQASGTAVQTRLGISDSPLDHREYLTLAGEGLVDPALVEQLAVQSSAAIEFMEELGLNYSDVYAMNPLPTVDPQLIVPRLHVPGVKVELGAGTEHVRVLEARARELGVVIRTRSPVEELILDKRGEVVGIVANDGRSSRVGARRGVVLASGGFDRNVELARALSPQLAWELETGEALTALSNTGDGLVMAMRQGAALSTVSGTIGVPRTPIGSGALAPGLPSLPGIWVNRHGRRFVNEGVHYSYAMRSVFAQEGHVAWAIFDQPVRALGGAALGGIWGALSADLSEELDSGKIVTAPTVPELAKTLKISQVQLQRTLEEWNADAKLGEDRVFGRRNAVRALETGPFFATRVLAVSLGSCGGVRIDDQCRVIRADGSAIPGLFAAGMVSGGFIGPYYPGSGTAVAATVVFGRIAGLGASRNRIASGEFARASDGGHRVRALQAAKIPPRWGS